MARDDDGLTGQSFVNETGKMVFGLREGIGAHGLTDMAIDGHITPKRLSRQISPRKLLILQSVRDH